MSELFTAEEVAQRLGVTANWLMDRVRRRLIPHVRLGGYVKFSEADVQSILTSHRVSPKKTDSSGLAPRSATRRRRAS